MNIAHELLKLYDQYLEAAAECLTAALTAKSKKDQPSLYESYHRTALLMEEKADRIKRSMRALWHDGGKEAVQERITEKKLELQKLRDADEPQRRKRDWAKSELKRQQDLLDTSSAAALFGVIVLLIAAFIWSMIGLNYWTGSWEPGEGSSYRTIAMIVTLVAAGLFAMTVYYLCKSGTTWTKHKKRLKQEEKWDQENLHIYQIEELSNEISKLEDLAKALESGFGSK